MKTFITNIKAILTSKQMIWVSIFAIAMAMLESAVVIYLRELYYPDGFEFPLNATSRTVAITELLREVATLFMLLAIGVLVGKNKTERFAWFIYTFAVWDIFYYIFLYLIIDWPVSIMDWDVLFLLPMMWVGPVWSPVLLALLMIVLAYSILYSSKLGNTKQIGWKAWTLFISGSIICIIAFCQDFYRYMRSSFPDVKSTELFLSKQTFNYASNYAPEEFALGLFLLGASLIAIGIGYYIFRMFRD